MVQHLCLLFVLLLPSTAAAQVMVQQTPAPHVTAEHEAWYLKGDPVAFAGELYYPAGAQVFFNPNEMVRSGNHKGIPLYTKTTIEPYSVIFVPVAGGRMQPYEKLRSGPLAGTSGSQPASLTSPYDPHAAAGMIHQAPGSPWFGPGLIRDGAASEASWSRGRDRVIDDAERTRVRPQHVRLGGAPRGINAIYVDYDGQRWYSSGRVVDVDVDRMRPTRDYKGFGVWRSASRKDVIYLATTHGSCRVVEYSLTRPTIEGLDGRGRLF